MEVRNGGTYRQPLGKAWIEQEKFVTHLETLPPKEIIEMSYEKVMRDDILMIFEEADLSTDHVRALLKLEQPLASCYSRWLKNDLSHMEMLQDTITSFSDRLVKESKHQETFKRKLHKEKSGKCR